jgi:hypothetical protein
MTQDDSPTTPDTPTPETRAREREPILDLNLIEWARRCLKDRWVDRVACDVITLALDELERDLLLSRRERNEPGTVITTEELEEGLRIEDEAAPIDLEIRDRQRRERFGRLVEPKEIRQHGLDLDHSEAIPSDPVKPEPTYEPIPLLERVKETNLEALDRAANCMDLAVPGRAGLAAEIRNAIPELKQLRARVAEAIADEKRERYELDRWRRGHEVLNAALAESANTEAKLRLRCAQLADRLAAMTIPPLDRGPVTHAASNYRPGSPACDVEGMRPGDFMAKQRANNVIDCQACKDAIALAEALREEHNHG